MRLTVCICTRNRPDELDGALASIARSSVPVHEVVVSDDSGDDASRAVAERHGARWHRGPRAGLGPNRNAAARAATGSHVLFLDDDARLGRDFVARVAPLATEGVIVTGREDNDGRIVEARAVDRLGFQSRPYRPGEPRHTIVINATVFPREALERLGFDEHLVYGYDEVDITGRAVAEGYRVVERADAINHHHPSPVNRDYYAPHVHASRLYITIKHRIRVRRQPLRGTVVAGALVVHLFAAQMRRDGLTGARSAARSVAEAARALRRGTR